MGNTDTKLNFRKAVVQLTSKTQPIDTSDDNFWNQFWAENSTTVQDIFTLLPAAEIRAVREEAPANLATLCYKAVEKLVKAVDNSCRTQLEQQTVLNCVRLLTRILPYIFEDPDWRGFFWSSLPAGSSQDEEESTPLAQSLINADLLFCPDFTVIGNRKSGPDKAEELSAVDSCEYIWEAGVGFAHSPPRLPQYDVARTELLKLLLTCFSETIYQPPVELKVSPNKWIQFVTSAENRHALPMFTSLLNTVCAYDPVGLGVPYNHLLFSDTAEPLVDAALQILIVTLDHDTSLGEENIASDNLFINYLSRIHRDEDFQFVLGGFSRLLNNPLVQTYLPNSTKKVQFHQELLVFFWKLCDYNKKFLYYVLKSSSVLDILVPILYHLNDSRADQSRVGLMHIGVFILLLLSGERNFGVRLNKPYMATVPMDIPVFTGTHADLLIIVFHKVITTGHQRLQPLFDCLLTILVNVSPYLKTLSMVASTKLLHLLEAFSTPWFLLSAPSNHHLVFFLLEIFNNIIQYQFDGNIR
ncbi:cell wall biogenesis protein [Polyplax serrata]|uniref:Cell wall biogenesis protein n=1 Tax=Polyplax serrata TaxID=468196 RepID=A0ABR1BE01_POLSC